MIIILIGYAIIYEALDHVNDQYLPIFAFKIFLIIFCSILAFMQDQCLEKILIQKKKINDLLKKLEVINNQTALINADKYVYIKEYDINILEFNNFKKELRLLYFSNSLLDHINLNPLSERGENFYLKFKEEQKLWG